MRISEFLTVCQISGFVAPFVRFDFGSELNIVLSIETIVFQEHAFESSQKYKEGKFIIELAHMVKDNQWEDGKKRKSI
ncbi:hypothetical protein Y032_0499g2553 [Ancylostoma ceylanicum]|uniref:Yippee domain-containing protein n=1 Tax=Ancylostoma ceylanicum TaxID=53326 RepID=A0A016WW25_9BILA|nr:hypothetical protein Y032_0499g2553 [Ancylostoma ceylanicum]